MRGCRKSLSPHPERARPECSERAWVEGDINQQSPRERQHLADLRGYGYLEGKEVPRSGYLTDACRLEMALPAMNFCDTFDEEKSFPS